MSEADLQTKWSGDQSNPVAFGATFVRSESFMLLFREGMELIEDVAAYLDGPGRDESRLLSRQAALAYASESMQLTTRLMQIASWLLVQRAVANGEITSVQAASERRRVHLTQQNAAVSPGNFSFLPERMKRLVGLSLRLHARILHLDGLLGHETPSPAARATSPVAMQQWLIRSAFSP